VHHLEFIATPQHFNSTIGLAVGVGCRVFLCNCREHFISALVFFVYFFLGCCEIGCHFTRAVDCLVTLFSQMCRVAHCGVASNSTFSLHCTSQHCTKCCMFGFKWQESVKLPQRRCNELLFHCLYKFAFVGVQSNTALVVYFFPLSDFLPLSCTYLHEGAIKTLKSSSFTGSPIR